MKSGMFLLMSIFLIAGCKTTSKLGNHREIIQHTYAFPQDWVGLYQGNLVIYPTIGDTTQIKMELIIDQPDALGLYPWVIKYGDKDVRYYGLEAINTEQGHYRIDEYNSIKIDGYLRDNHFTTHFDVTSNKLIFYYERVPEGIEIRVHIYGLEPVSETGGEVIGEEKVPTVESFALKAFQVASLRKVK